MPDDKHERIKSLEKSNKVSVNKLVDELATVDLANFDTKTRFEARAKTGNAKFALQLLEKFED